MSCTSCGEKPSNCSNDFTKSVIEIENPEKLVLLRKVLVPASLGDSRDFPPVIGKYHNVILQYEADNALFIYSSDGIPTAIESSIPADVYHKLLELEAEDVVLHKEIDDTNTALSGEKSAREDADGVLDGKITALDGSLATVAKSGSYADLTNKPTIGNGTITFTENNVEKGTFSANATTNKTIEFPVPTQTSELTNNGSDGTSTYAEVDELPTIDTTYNSGSGNPIANSTVTNSLDRAVMTDLTLNSTTSTTTVSLNNTKTNLANPSSTTTTSISLPVASTTQAGIMNSATYDAVVNNTNNINALINGAVAVTGLSANPSQSDITTAWQTATGLTTLINRASVYDVTNDKVWTYYTNDTTWHVATNTTQVTVNPFTNSSAGIIKGSTSTGQVFAENDGTGSVNGWDTLNNTVSDHTSKLATIAQGAEVNVQSDWTQTNTSADDYIKNKPSNLVSDASYVHTDNNFTTTLKNKLDGIAAGAEVNVQADWDEADSSSDAYIQNKPTIPTVNDATLTIQQNGSTVQTFTANASSNKTANINASKRVALSTSQSDTCRWVIALCEVNTSSSEEKNSFSSGTIYFKRGNGSGAIGQLDICIMAKYHTVKSITVSGYSSNWPRLAPSTDITSTNSVGWRPCVFKYNDKWYGGIEGMIELADANKWFHGEGNFNPFYVVYYKVPYQGAAGEIRNQEIYNSLDYDGFSIKTYHDMTNFIESVDLRNGYISKNNHSYTLSMPNKDGTIAVTDDVPVITMTTTDPGEGSPLAENHFIAVYNAN